MAKPSSTRPLDAGVQLVRFFLITCSNMLTTASCWANVQYVGGLGGGVRGALHPDHSPEVVKAVKDGRIKLTAAGQETFVFPGGNLVFMVDVGPMPDGCFAWVPTPATVIPIEFSMTRATYDAVCGYPEAVIPLEKTAKLVRKKIIFGAVIFVAGKMGYWPQNLNLMPI